MVVINTVTDNKVQLDQLPKDKEYQQAHKEQLERKGPRPAAVDGKILIAIKNGPKQKFMADPARPGQLLNSTQPLANNH